MGIWGSYYNVPYVIFYLYSVWNFRPDVKPAVQNAGVAGVGVLGQRGFGVNEVGVKGSFSVGSVFMCAPHSADTCQRRLRKDPLFGAGRHSSTCLAEGPL